MSLRPQDTSPGAQGQRGPEKGAFTPGRSTQGSAQHRGQEGGRGTRAGAAGNGRELIATG